MTFGENFQRLRKQAGLSQEDVAQKLFISRQSVSKWENGGAEPGIEHLIALADLYGVTVDELVGNVRHKPEEESQEREKSQEAYHALVMVRVISAIIISAGTMYYYGSCSIPIDLIALLVGIWVPHSAIWIISLILLVMNAVTGVMSLIAEGDVFSGFGMIICAVCLWALNRPEIRARFNMRKEEEL